MDTVTKPSTGHGPPPPDPLDLPVQAAGPWQLFWNRFKGQRVAMAAGIFLLFVLAAIIAGGPILSRILGHGPNDLFPFAVSDTLRPVGPWTRVADTGYLTDGPPPKETTLLVLGADGQLGRDELLRLLDGGRVSLAVALGGTLLAMAIGAIVGAVAAYFGRWVDATVSRVTELVMAFPVIFFILMLGSTVGDRLDGVTFGGLLVPGVFPLILIIGAFTWFYPARIVRTEIESLRQRDFVEAARMVGASDSRILRTHLLPHLVPTLIAYSTLLLATNILLEAGLSYLGVGIKLPTASWGSLLSTAWGTARAPNLLGASQATVWLTLFPSLAILATVLAFNLLGEGLRAAADPSGTRR
jgi:peptide/nickel transport system permease protein